MSAAIYATQAARLRAAGASYSQIADTVKYTEGPKKGDPVYSGKAAAFHAVDRILKDAHREAVDELRELEGQRLDEIRLTVWNRALGLPYTANGVAVPAKDPDPQLIALLLRTSEAFRKLFGLDMPTKEELSGPNGGPIPVDVNDARTALIDRFLAISRRRADAGSGNSEPVA